jgi:FkbM family methyltransferase
VPQKIDQFYFYSPGRAEAAIDAGPIHPRTLRTSMKQLIQSIVGRFGFRLIRLDDRVRPIYGLDSFFPLLKQFGFAPKHIIDVGANHGEWTRTAIKYFPDALYTLVEPQDRLKVHISDLLDHGHKIRWLNVGASDKSGSSLFTVSHRDDRSSFALAEEERGAGLQQITVEVKTLNDIASPIDMPPPEIVKIDAEGFDLKVLSGASDLLGKVDIFLIEAGFCASFENSVLSVVTFMAKAGYQLIDITELNRSPKHGVLWVSELAFLRNGSPLLECVTSYE